MYMIYDVKKCSIFLPVHTFNSKIKSGENIQYFTSRIKTKFPYKHLEDALCLVFEGRFSVPRKPNIL